MHLTTALFSNSPSTVDEKGISTRALCLYEGEFEAMSGAVLKFSTDRLKKIVAASNKHLNSGIQVPVYAGDVDHGYSQNAKVGIIEGPYEGKVITQDDLPDPNLTDLIGKFGIFTQVRLTKAQAIADYKAKLLKPISVGIDTLAQRFSKFKDAIYELSGVSFSAVHGAQLFARGIMPNHLDAIAQFAAMNFQNELVRKQAFDKLYMLQDSFCCVLREILEGEPDELEAPKEVLLRQLITDYAQALSDRLLSIPAEVQAMPPAISVQFSTPPEPETEEEDDMANEQLAAMQARIAQFEQRDRIATLSTRVNARARALFAAAKIIPAHLAKIEAGAGTVDEAIAKFSATQDLGETIKALEKLEVQLEGLEQFASPVTQFGSLVAGEPLPNAPFSSPADEAAQIEKRAAEILLAAASARY
jgi:hypothetical protein